VKLPLPIERSTRDALEMTIADRAARAAFAAIEARGRFVMCIAGGSVAEGALDRIARAPLPWPQVHVVWADERAVPRSSADSNAGGAMRRWAGTPMAASSAHPMAGDAPDLAAAAIDYERQLIELFGDAPVIDFALLGVGDDGHIASLFPGRLAVDESVRLVLAEVDSPKPPPRRLTLSLPFLAGAREIIVAAFGTAKEATIVAATTDPANATPVARLIRAAVDVTVMRDE
jgi:6-phosphogluconolactonase